MLDLDETETNEAAEAPAIGDGDHRNNLDEANATAGHPLIILAAYVGRLLGVAWVGDEPARAVHVVT